ncbi:hypothetical protein [Paenibacillus sp. FSL H8-0034]|uniref:hypothetical protein n=1 Tax=Paenibacillus sp. FSL H8-0034 TaxID=2954671 RepID=UPI0030F9D2CF
MNGSVESIVSLHMKARNLLSKKDFLVICGITVGEYDMLKNGGNHHLGFAEVSTIISNHSFPHPSAFVRFCSGAHCDPVDLIQLVYPKGGKRGNISNPYSNFGNEEQQYRKDGGRGVVRLEFNWSGQ